MDLPRYTGTVLIHSQGHIPIWHLMLDFHERKNVKATLIKKEKNNDENPQSPRAPARSFFTK
jgi:hypothetical protein